MPHVVVKSYPGKTEEQKKQLAEEITKAVMNAFGSKNESVSVAIEDVPKEEWAERIYKAEIMKNPERLYKKPGYTM